MGARDIVLESGDAIGLARIAIDLADIFQWLGDHRRAKEETDLASAMVGPLIGDDGITQGDVLQGVMASVRSIMAGKGDSGEAEKKAGLYRANTEITYYRGLIAKALGQWDEAERHFNRVLPEYRMLRCGEAIEFQLAQIDLNRGRHGEALRRAQSIAPVFERGDFRPKLGAFQKLQAERLRARIYSDTGDRVRALKSWREAIGTVAGLRRSPLGYRLDSTFPFTPWAIPPLPCG